MDANNLPDQSSLQVHFDPETLSITNRGLDDNNSEVIATWDESEDHWEAIEVICPE